MTAYRNIKQGKPQLRKIPFLQRFEKSLLDGTKTATTRRIHYAFKGDWFKAFGAMFLVTDTLNVPLGTVKDGHWKEEGVSSPEEFEEVWNGIHPRRQFNPNDGVVLHLFRRTDK